MRESTATGFDIALLGIDGIGKTTLSNALADALREHGCPVTVTSWRDYFRHGDSGPHTNVLTGLYTTLFRSIYSAYLDPDGNSASRLLPASDKDFLRAEHEPLPMDHEAVPLALDRDRPATFLAAGLMEIAARMLERELVINPAVARGEVVVQEGHGLKTAVKLGAVTASLVGSDEQVALYLSAARQLLGTWATPTCSVFVSGDPQLAYRWRRAQSGTIGRGERLDRDGRPAQSTFVQLQTTIHRELAATAEAEQWPTVVMSDRPRRENLAEAVTTILDALAGQGLLPTGTRS